LLLGHSLAAMGERERGLLRRRHLGFVFQQFNLIPGLSARDNLLFQRRLNRMPDEDAWVDDLVAALELEVLLDRRVELLSSGQQQRVAIARALAHRPEVVFADEPTGNLHDTLSRQVMGLFMRLVEEAGSSILLVTHNEQMARYCRRQWLLREGQLHDVTAHAA